MGGRGGAWSRITVDRERSVVFTLLCFAQGEKLVSTKDHCKWINAPQVDLSIKHAPPQVLSGYALQRADGERLIDDFRDDPSENNK
jgi:hypothetical protein